MHSLMNQVCREKAAFDEFLDVAGLIDEYADRKAHDAVHVRDFIVFIHEHWEGMFVSRNVFLDSFLILQFIDSQNGKPLLSQFVVSMLHSWHFFDAGFTPSCPEVQ